MRVSLNITNYSWDGDPVDRLVDVAQAADQGGIDTLWVNDHLMQAEPGTTTDEPMLEAYTALGFLAAQTRRVRLGTMVTGVTFRPAALLVKAVTTVDALSRGRAWLGIGAGYHAAEAEMLGLPLPRQRERFEILDETLALARQMWAGDRTPFSGTHLRLTDPVASPVPGRRPPVLVGGMGEQRTLRLVARYADACNLFDIPDGGGTLRHKLDVLRQRCDEAGRDYDEIDKTVSARFDPTQAPGDFVAHCRELGSYGLTHVVCITTGPWRRETVEALAAVATALG